VTNITRVNQSTLGSLQRREARYVPQTRTGLKKPGPTFPTPAKLPPKLSKQIVNHLVQDEIKLMPLHLVLGASLAGPFP